MRNLRRRIERLEAMQPLPVILELTDGTSFHYPGPALSFWMEGITDIYEKRSTPLLDAVFNTVSATGCGLVWQLLQVLHAPFAIKPK
jgi:hypothetical protein